MPAFDLVAVSFDIKHEVHIGKEWLFSTDHPFQLNKGIKTYLKHWAKGLAKTADDRNIKILPPSFGAALAVVTAGRRTRKTKLKQYVDDGRPGALAFIDIAKKWWELRFVEKYPANEI